MPCYFPVRAFLGADGSVSFSELRHDFVSSLDLPCGRCMGCRLDRSRDWAIRCVHESKLHKQNSFVTLTYSPEHLPPDNGLHYEHFQKFIRRLRKKAPKFRFFMCGEYGDDTDRPHYHAILFGLSFPDQQRFGGSDAKPVYISRTLEHIWGLGSCTVQAVNFSTARYVAGYIHKKRLGKDAAKFYERVTTDGEIISRALPLSRMSLKPGIGRPWLDKFFTDAFPHGNVISKGRETKTPKYYERIYKKLDPDGYAELVHQRYKFSLKHPGENTDERLHARSEVATAAANLKPRSL